MTPDKARELLEQATAGPWQSRGDGPSSGKPHLYVCTCEDRTEVAEAVGWDDAPLIAAAPDLAALVAGMHYEYSVQARINDEWRSLGLHGAWTNVSLFADWRCDLKQVEYLAKILGAIHNVRIVRRLVSEEEVVS